MWFLDLVAAVFLLMNLSIKCTSFCIVGTHTRTASADFFYLVLIRILFGWTQKSLLSRDKKLPHPTLEVLVMLVKVLLLIAYTVLNNNRRLYSLTTDRKLAKIIQNSSFHPSSSSLHISNSFYLYTYKECIGLFADWVIRKYLSLAKLCYEDCQYLRNFSFAHPVFCIDILQDEYLLFTVGIGTCHNTFYMKHAHIISFWIKRTWSY